MTQLRDYQIMAITKALRAYEKGNVFRLNMFVGTGKTITAIKLAEAVGAKNVVVATHTSQLRDQFKDVVQFVGAKMGIRFHVQTYHSLRVRTPTDVDLLIVDEAHQGGLNKESGGSYRTIVAKMQPKKILALSATDFNLDQSIFGAKEYENTFTYNIREAVEAGITAPCVVRTIHTGLTQLLSDGSMIEAETLEEMVEELKNRDVSLKDKRSIEALMDRTLRAVFEVYLEHERGNQAVVYVPSIAAAEMGVQLAEELKLPVRARAVHSALKDMDDTLDAFKAGEFDLLFNCRILQEGFDMPGLKVAFDTCPSTSNGARIFTQRCGRILRRDGDKSARYYILVGAASTHYSVSEIYSGDKRLKSQAEAHIEFTGAIAEEIRPTTAGPDWQAAIDKPMSLKEGFLEETLENLIYPDGRPKDYEKPTVLESRLFVEMADGYKDASIIPLRNLVIPSSAEEKKKELIQLLKKGESRPSSKAGTLGQALVRYTSPSQEEFDPKFLEEITALDKEIFPDSKGWLGLSEEKIQAQARKFRTPEEWRRADTYAVNKAKELGILDSVTRHMTKRSVTKLEEHLKVLLECADKPKSSKMQKVIYKLRVKRPDLYSTLRERKPHWFKE